MSINIKKFTNTKSFKMSESETARVVAKYVVSIILEQIKWMDIYSNESGNNMKCYSSNVESKIEEKTSNSVELSGYMVRSYTSTYNKNYITNSRDSLLGEMAA